MSITLWLGEMFLNISIECIKNNLIKKDIDYVLLNEMKYIVADINNVLEAPFSVAMEYFDEYCFLKAKDDSKAAEVLDLIEQQLLYTISYEPLNYVAKLLYIGILSNKGMNEKASKKYLDFLNEFTFRKDLIDMITPGFYEKFAKYFIEDNSIRFYGGPSKELKYDNRYFIEDFWCSNGGIAVHWAKENHWFDWQYWCIGEKQDAVKVFSWDEREIFDNHDEGNALIKMVTGYYFVIFYPDKGIYKVFRLEDGKEIGRPLTSEMFESIFMPLNINLDSIDLYKNVRFNVIKLYNSVYNFKNIRLSYKIHRCEVRDWEGSEALNWGTLELEKV